MDTKEHTALGNALRFPNTGKNPYLRVDTKGVLHLQLQRYGKNKFPVPLNVEVSAGEIIGMSGDYFTDPNWHVDIYLPEKESFESAAHLGNHLIKKQFKEKELTAITNAYNFLAAPNLRRKEIDDVYAINEANYTSFSSTLNSYIQELMYSLRLRDYSGILLGNKSHFTPWSIRVYILGHRIALGHARLSYELTQMAKNPQFTTDNPDWKALQHYFSEKKMPLTKEILFDLAYRYQALSYGMELFTFHYYSDHFATGHMSMIGDLREILQDRFGFSGGLLVNSLHDEINRVGAFTWKPYDPTKNPLESATRARGDGAFDTHLNQPNHQECMDGMHYSLQDIDNVLHGGSIPHQNKYGGLESMPDVDYNSRQHQPLIVLRHGKVYYRSNLSKIQILSPTEFDALRADPEQHGYTEITGKWSAFVLVIKLRFFSMFYKGTVQPVSKERQEEIKLDEKKRNPKRQPIITPDNSPSQSPTVIDWRTPKSTTRGRFNLFQDEMVNTVEEPEEMSSGLKL